MRLRPGSRLGRFEIRGLIGAGGMGEVYRAHDPELEREVAIKVLPSELAESRERIRRFGREARAIGRLNHPNVLSVHDVGEEAGVAYVVSELLDGMTLRERCDGRPLPLHEAVALAAQAAEGLAAAHDEGIVHRDLKPENLFIISDGRLKILDFGLAKLVQPQPTADTRAATLTAATREGMVMGTAGYLSPEQALGVPVDFRADQFALGAVLYELLTGTRAFGRETVPESMAAVVREEPLPVGTVREDVPAPLAWIVERCLNKNPKQRYGSTADLAADLRLVRDHLPQLTNPAGRGRVEPETRPRRLVTSLLLVVSLLALGSIAGFLGSRRDSTAGSGPMDLRYQKLTFRRGTVPAARFGADGSGVLYSAAWDGGPPRLFLKRPEAPEPIQIGGDHHTLNSVSTTGQLLVTTEARMTGPFQLLGTLAQLPPTGGSARELAIDVYGADWSPSGPEMAVVRRRGDSNVLEYPEGNSLYSTVRPILYPRVSPSGDQVAFLETERPSTAIGRIHVADLQTNVAPISEPTWVNGLAWSPAGDEVWYAESGVLVAVPASGGKQRILLRLPRDIALHDVARDGRLLLSQDRIHIGIVKGTVGESEQDLSWLGWSVPTDLSADGGTVLFTECNAYGATCMVCLRRADDSPPVVLGEGFGTALSPDGRWALSVPFGGAPQLLPTGAGQARSLPLGELRTVLWATFSADGTEVILSAIGRREGLGIYRQPVDGGVPKLITPAKVESGLVEVSPDDRFAVVSEHGGVVLYPLGAGEPRRIPWAEAEILPAGFSGDGNQLYLWELGGAQSRLLRLDLATEGMFEHVTLSPSDSAGVDPVGPVRVTPDGRTYVYGYRRVLSELYLATPVGRGAEAE